MIVDAGSFFSEPPGLHLPDQEWQLLADEEEGGRWLFYSGLLPKI
jgi:hypothetical protein